MRPRRGLTPALLGGLVAVASLGGFFVTRAVTSGPDRADVQTVATSTAATVTARLDADGRLLVAASEAIGGDPSQSADQLSASLSRVASTGQVIGVVKTSSTDVAVVSVAVPPRAATTVVGLDIGGQPEFRLLLDIARDAGTPEVAVGAGRDGRVVVIQAQPLFGTPAVPADVASRRSSLQGYVVLFEAEPARLGLAASADASDFAVRVVQGQTVLAASSREAGERPSSFVTAPITANGATWTVEAWSIHSPSNLPWALLIGGLVVAVVVAALAMRRERSIQTAVAVAESRAQELALVARAGPLLQQSLASSDLFPLFALEISDELDLDTVSISLVSDTGHLVRVFSLGIDASPFDVDPAQLTLPDKTIAPDRFVTVPLQRSGRIVGALRAHAESGLSEPQVDTLVAVCNLLAAALGNARLFQNEQEMVAQLRDVDRKKTTFVSSMSHELRTTVTAIDGFAGLLDGAPGTLDDARRSDFIERIRRNARSLGVLVEDLLDFARFERSAVPVALKPIDLSELVPQVVDQTSSLLDGHSVSTDVAPGVIVMGDLSAIERVLVNLLSNAAKYTPLESAVEVELARDGRVAVLTVSDHGRGIPEDQREKVFELFYRVDDPGASATRGVGIGLALARQLIEQIDGTITVGESPGGGASFRVTIPLVEELVAPPQPSRSPGTRSN